MKTNNPIHPQPNEIKDVDFLATKLNNLNQVLNRIKLFIGDTYEN